MTLILARRTPVRHPFVSQRWHKKAAQSAAHRVGPRPLVYSQGVDERECFYVGRLIMTNPTVARETLTMVARRTLVWHPFVSQDGIKKPHRVPRAVWDHRLWLIVTGRG